MLRYTKDVLEELKKAGWSEYRIRNEKMLPSSTINALRLKDTGISTRSIDRICEMLGDAQPGDFIEYFNPLTQKDSFTEMLWEHFGHSPK